LIHQQKQNQPGLLGQLGQQLWNLHRLDLSGRSNQLNQLDL
jgi:hypothetical protein